MHVDEVLLAFVDWAPSAVLVLARCLLLGRQITFGRRTPTFVLANVLEGTLDCVDVDSSVHHFDSLLFSLDFIIRLALFSLSVLLLQVSANCNRFSLLTNDLSGITFVPDGHSMVRDASEPEPVVLTDLQRYRDDSPCESGGF